MTAKKAFVGETFAVGERLAAGLALTVVLLAGCGSQSRSGSGSSGPSSAPLTPAITAPPATAPAATAPTVTTPAPSTPATTALAGPAFPPRPAGSPTGREFLDKTASLPRLSKTAANREDAIVHELLAGNVPDYNRAFVDLKITSATHAATLHVLPDYLAIGSNADNVRIPMGSPSAQKVADAFDCVLPTSKVVDLIWKAATVKLTPKPLPPTAAMITNAWFRQHADAVDAQLVGKPSGVLTAGHKKDVISSNLIALHPGHVVIYGWHQSNGVPIQGRQWIHEETYADYSHGVRLVSRSMELDGQTVLVEDVLKDGKLASLLSDEGPIVQPRY